MSDDIKTVVKNGKEKRVAAPDMVARAKLRIEVRFKHLKAGKPSKWGDVSTLLQRVMIQILWLICPPRNWKSA
jgi:hypothetical protein